MTSEATPPKAYRKRVWQRGPGDGFHWLNLSLSLAVAVPLFLLPMAIMVAYSFGSQDYLTGVIQFGWTLDAWQRLGESDLIRIFLRSMALASFATVACAVLGYPLAYFVARHAGRFKTAALILIIAPFWVSFIVRAYAWLDILGNQGPVNRALQNLGVIDEPLALVNNNVGIAIGITYSYLPLMIFPLYVALDRIEPTIIESARDLGASGTSAFWRVTFPQALPGLVGGCILVWVPALGEYVIPTIMGGGKTFMFGNLIALRFSQLDWPLGAAMAVAMMLVALAVVALALRIVGRERLDPADMGTR
jgi:spermidine/putrescine transport system permease protein